MSFSPVKRVAVEAGLPVFQPKTLRDGDVQAELQELAPDAIVVVAFGQLLPKAVLDMPRLGCINVHASLLPRHRGAAPIQAALAAGDDVTGVTTMFMDEGLDTGDIILRREVPIDPDDDAGSLHDKLAAEGAALLVETVARLQAGDAPRIVQNDEEATYAPRLTKEDARVQWSKDARAVVNHVRAFAPRPGAWTTHRGEPVKILRAYAFEEDGPAGAQAFAEGGAGAIVGTVDEGIIVQTGRGRAVVTQLQPPGRRAMSGRDYSNGFRVTKGERFGDSLEAP